MLESALLRFVYCWMNGTVGLTGSVRYSYVSLVEARYAGWGSERYMYSVSVQASQVSTSVQ